MSSDQGLQVFTRDGEGWQDRGRWPLGVEPDDLAIDGDLAVTVRAYTAGNGPPELVTGTLLDWQVGGLTVGEGWVAAADDDGSVVVMSAAPDLQVLATLDLGLTLDIVGAGSHLLSRTPCRWWDSRPPRPRWRR